MAIVPWTNAVNMGSAGLADNVRGTPTPGVAIQSATWKSGAAVNISAITKANPGVVTTSSNHGLVNGDALYITGVKGMTSVNNIEYIVHNKTNTTFELWDTGGNKIDTSSASKYTSAGTVQKCLTLLCEMAITTSSAHGYTAGDFMYNVGTNGLSSPTDFDGLETVGTVLSPTSFIWPNVFGPKENAYTSAGTTYCTKYGCNYYYFPNAAGTSTLYQANYCATERTTNAYTDTAPSTTPLGFNYTSSAGACITQAIQPLTSDRTTLHNLVQTLTAAGSTAGHLGLAWGWYMVAPNFGYLWPSSQPATYGRANLIKAVILMTDGQFNLQYCNGVLDSDAGSGTGNIDCTSPNGNSLTQAQALCDAIKAPTNDIVLYTVGFYLGSDTASLNFLKGCATAPSDFFQADSPTALNNAFTSIAQNLNDLRISK
jgi:Ubiquitin-activating enzyme E1 FCCH domain